MDTVQKQYLKAILPQLSAILPKLVPIEHFSHTNPLGNYQHLHFENAIADFSKLTGIPGYLPEAKFHELYKSGQISDSDLDSVLQTRFGKTIDTQILNVHNRVISQAELFRLALLHEFEPILPNQLAWQVEELAALERFQDDVPIRLKAEQLKGTQSEAELIAELWQTLLMKLELEQASLHPENMLDLSLDQAEALLAQHKASLKKNALKKTSMHERMKETILLNLKKDLGKLGIEFSLRNLILALSGIDVLDSVRPQLIRICSAALNQGTATWRLPIGQQHGIYSAWRNLEKYDINPFLQELPDWQTILAECPETPEEAILFQLNYFEIPETQWRGYLERLLMELPGWSAIIDWYEHHAYASPQTTIKPTLADYLAIRLTLDRLWLTQVCRDTWQIEAKISSLLAYFRKNSSEYLVRSHLFSGDLPEYLIEKAQAITTNVGSEHYDRSDWQQLADMIWTWQTSITSSGIPIQPVPLAGIADQTQMLKSSVYGSGWRLFRLCQHLGLTVEDLRNTQKKTLEQLLATLDKFTLETRQQVWLEAYELHYRNQLVSAISSSQNTQTNRPNPLPPIAQVIFCADNRAENIRRQLEILAPNLETFGTHKLFFEHNRSLVSNAPLFPLEKNFYLSETFEYLLRLTLHRNLLLSTLLLIVNAPLVAIKFVLEVFFPGAFHTVKPKNNAVELPVITSPPVEHFRINDSTMPTLDETAQNAKIIQNFLLDIGLSSFSRLVVIIGHAASTTRNPFAKAYACDLCNSRNNGRNAHEFAKLANHPDIRQSLAINGLMIPSDTWFLGAESSPGSDQICWYGMENLPQSHLADVKQIQKLFKQATEFSALEQYRRFNNRPKMSAQQALRNLRLKTQDFSDLRPDTTHATNAAVIIGRRSISRALNLDKRVFLVSYDPILDEDGAILEAYLEKLLLKLTDINLDYYFSTVRNHFLDSNSQVLNNINSGIGFMEGANSDLKFGLPKQVTEAHAAIRLELILEAQPTLIKQLLTQQRTVAKLIEHQWLKLIIVDPETSKVYVYSANQNFVEWQDRSDSKIIRDSASQAHINTPLASGSNSTIDRSLN